MLSVVCGVRSDVGRVRRHNEDSVLVGQQVWAVADGMGGHAAGDVASALVVAGLRALDVRESIRPPDLVSVLVAINDDIVRHGQEHPETRGLGSTVTGLAKVAVGGADHWAIFNIGDSRVYRLMGEDLARATIDHSETEELVLDGVITAEQARHHHHRNVITRSLGQAEPPQVDLWVLPQTPGERFLICSDGLSGEVEDADLRAILVAHPDPEAAADALVEAALAAGGRDNVTALVVAVEGSHSDDVDDQTNPRPHQE